MVSSTFLHRRGRLQAAAVVVTAGLCLAGTPSLVSPASGGTRTAAADPVTDADLPAFLGGHEGGADFDGRVGSVAPSLTQKRMVRELGARVTWNRFGTPASLIRDGGYLAKGLKGSDAQVARAWLRSHAGLFRLTRADVDALDLVNSAPLADNAGHAVTFRQRFGGLPATQDGLIIVGARDGKVAYVSSSSAGSQAAPAPAKLSPTEAWLAAAEHIGRDVSPADLGPVRTDDGWTVFPVDGFGTPTVGTEKTAESVDQRARLVAFPTFTDGVKAAFEVNVLDNRPGHEVTGFIVFVDARNGDILFRHNAVDAHSDGAVSHGAVSHGAVSNGLAMAPQGGEFSGEYATTGDECGPEHPLTVDADNRTLVVTAYPVVAFNDIRLVVRDPGGGNRGESDVTGTGIPEVVVVDLDPGAGEAGTWTAQVCESNNPVADSVPPTAYVGAYSAVDQQQPTNAVAFPPQWSYFPANPAIPDGRIDPPYDYPNTDDRVNACWTIQDPGAPSTCDQDLTPNQGDTNLASRVPWDHNVQSNLPSFMTFGNNAQTAEAWNAALTPGAFAQRPIDLDRTYGFEEVGDPQSPTGPLEGWTNSWNRNRCNYLVAQTPAENNLDVLAATTTLHVGHNRFHDFAYHLGFTERNYNLQLNNFGNTQPGPFPGGREDDPEIGDVQNGATLPAELGLTRDNANQITLQDGIPGITNQYLFQPIAGAFYAPCTDGDLDASIYGHEYTHAISNRMVAGPDSGLSGAQAGAMGESWSDQVAVEYLNAYGYVPTSAGENPFAVGIYATGNKESAIRNYGMNRSPLNFSNIGYDIVCEGTLVGPPVEPDCEDPEGQVHADGEIWSATGFEIRKALVRKYNKRFPYNNDRLQKRCADGNLPASKCPGNRRWIQLMFDSFLLQQADTSMLTARDAFLAADMMRFDGANQKVIWDAFAKRGMGINAVTKGTADDNPRPSFASPYAKEGTVRITPLALSNAGEVRVPGQLFVGDYEARTTPVADSDPKTKLSNRVRLVPGRYQFVFRANGHGLNRFWVDVKAGRIHDREVHLSRNMASIHNGAVIDGASENVHADFLIDDTEATNWAGRSPGVSVDESKPWVNVNLAGGRQTIRSVKVSALLRPVADQGDEDDPEAGSRFTALRQFAIEVCTEDGDTDCFGDAQYRRIFTSPANAFNASAPRPVAPKLLFRRFDVPDTQATHVRLVALENQCTGYAGFAGEQDNDPANDTDCKSASTRDETVRAAELQVFSYDTTTRPPGDPTVLMLMTSDPVLAGPGERVTYEMTYTNLGPAASSYARITVAELPVGLRLVSSSDRVIRDGRRLVWRLGTVRVDTTDSVRFTVKVAPNAAPGTVMLTQAQFTGAKTYSPPAAAVTVVGP